MSVLETLPRIHKLPDTVANQIAAGEVIERPASVVKELIENSIDAAASKIYIDIEQSGIGLIRIRDDGQGIHKDDLNLALQPHATSKLSSISDFAQIASLGFRGEAIPSIASVSRFTLTSKLQEAEQAWSIDNHFEVKPAAHAKGTTVEVKDLFYTTPARRKFLKSERTELLHIQSLIRAIALSHFSIGFFVKNEGQSLFRLPACHDDPGQRVMDICGRSFLNKSIAIDVENDGIRLWGWLGLNDVARSQSDRQYFYVNGRYVHDKHVNHAIRLAYDGRIDKGRFPGYVLHLHIDPARVDVNVHPAKSEVRFAETRNIHDFIYSSLLEGLNKPASTFGSEINYQNTEAKSLQNINETFDQYQVDIKQQADLLQDRKNVSTKYTTLLADQYIIASIHNDQYLIDTGKARELLTEHYLHKHYQSGKITQRPIMVPISCQLNKAKLDVAVNNADQVKQWGFELEQISPDQIMIRAIPGRLACADTIALVNDLIDSLFNKKNARVIARQLAKHVNDAGLNLADENIQQLINQIKSYEPEGNDERHLPWRKLDQATLASLLDKK